MSTDLVGLDWGSVMRDVGKGLLVKPIVHNYLFDAKFPAFSMNFPEEEMERRPDDWFHPSTHPTWPEAALYNYLAHPETFPVEKKQYMSTLSVTVGKAMHGFMEMCLEDAGIRPRALNVCTVCPPQCPRPKGRGKVKRCGCHLAEGLLNADGTHKVGCTEPGVVDLETGSRGHMDGILDLSSMSTPGPAFDTPVFEFKTGNDMALAKLPDLDLEAYRKKYPAYYAQNQEYMRMSGRRVVIVLFMVMGFPWPMTEIHVPYDAGFANEVRDKYLRVRQMVADQTPPRCCGRKASCASGPICRVFEAQATLAAKPKFRGLAL